MSYCCQGIESAVGWEIAIYSRIPLKEFASGDVRCFFIALLLIWCWCRRAVFLINGEKWVYHVELPCGASMLGRWLVIGERERVGQLSY